VFRPRDDVLLGWNVPRSKVREEAKALLITSGAFFAVSARALAASLVFLAVYALLWDSLIEVWPFPFREAMVAALLMPVVLLVEGAVAMVFSEPMRYAITQSGFLSSNAGRSWKIPWGSLTRWNTIYDAASNSHLLLIQQMGLSPRRVLLPDQETATRAEWQLASRAKRDETFGLPDAPIGFATVLGISAAWVYGLSLVWGGLLGFAIACAFSTGVAGMNTLLLGLLLNLFVGLPGVAVYLRWRRLWPGSARLGLRIGFSVNFLSSVMAFPFVGLFAVAQFLERLAQ